MLGPPKPHRLDAPIAVSLEDLVPQNHFYHHLEATFEGIRSERELIEAVGHNLALR